MEVVLKYDPLNPDEVKAAQQIVGSEPVVTLTGGIMPELKAFHPVPNAANQYVAPVSSVVAQEAAAVAMTHPVVVTEGTAPTLDDDQPPPPVKDSRGLPWDGRIHASSMATNADGSWRNKRGVDKDLLAAVEAELEGRTEAMAAPASLGDLVPPPPPAEPASLGDAPLVPPPPAPAEAAPPPPPPAPATDEVVTFQECMTLFTQHKDRKDAKEFLNPRGFTGLPDLFKADNSVRVAFKAWVLS